MPFRNGKELKLLLEKYEIGYGEYIVSDVVYENQTQGCYCDFMKEEIDKKFGKTFIDSLLSVSDSLYVQNNINGTFDYGICDTRPNYPTDTVSALDEYSEVFQRDFDSKVKYPVGYIKSPGQNTPAFADVRLYVDKSGNASVTSFWFLFDVKQNHRYERYFEREIKRVMRKSGWTPATILKQKVNSDMVMRLGLD